MKTKLNFILLLFPVFLFAQVKPGDLPKEVRKEFRDTLREAKRISKEQQKAGWDFTLDPIEVPVNLPQSRDANTQRISNWGERILSPESIRQRLKNECTYKVVGRICDTGRPTHSDLRQGQGQSRNFTTSTTVDDLQGHATHVGGIAAAKDFGLLWPLVESGVFTQEYAKFLSDQGSGSFTWVKQGYDTYFPEDQRLNTAGVAVVYNGSFGTFDGTRLPDVEASIKKAVDLGDTYFVFAAGNQGSKVGYPGSSAYAITASALDESLRIANYSNRGPEVTNAAPGTLIQSCWLNNEYRAISGTSMASPFLYALVIIAESKWGPKIKGTDQMRKYLAWVSSDLGAPGRDDLYGSGLIYVQKILDSDPARMPGYTPPGTPPTPPNPPTPPTPPNPPVDQPKGTHIQQLYIPGYFVQNWRTQNNSTMKKLHVRFWFRVTTNRMADAVYSALSAATTRNFQNQFIIARNSDDYHDAAIWAGHFLAMRLAQDPELIRLEAKAEIVKIEAFDQSQRYCEITNPKPRNSVNGAAWANGEQIIFSRKKFKYQ